MQREQHHVDAPPSHASSGNVTIVSAVPTDSRYRVSQLALRQAILDWRDAHMERIDRLLRERIDKLHIAIEEACHDMSLQHLAVPATQKAFCEARLTPMFERWAETQAKELLSAAQADLAKIANSIIAAEDSPGVLEAEASTQHITDAKQIGAVIGAGVIAIPVIGSLSVGAAGGIAGLLGATVISWPVVLVGTVVVGSLFAFGGKRTTEFKARAVHSFVEKVNAAIDAQIIGTEDESDCLNNRLQTRVFNSAVQILREAEQ